MLNILPGQYDCFTNLATTSAAIDFLSRIKVLLYSHWRSIFIINYHVNMQTRTQNLTWSWYNDWSVWRQVFSTFQSRLKSGSIYLSCPNITNTKSFWLFHWRWIIDIWKLWNIDKLFVYPRKKKYIPLKQMEIHIFQALIHPNQLVNKL